MRTMWADLADMAHRLQPTWRAPHIFRRQLYRANMPNGGKTATGVHYDHIFLRGGPPTALTAWVPIGDCTPQQGGLMYLDNSRSLGERLEHEFTQKAKEAGLSEEETLSAFNKHVRLSVTRARDIGRKGPEADHVKDDLDGHVVERPSSVRQRSGRRQEMVDWRLKSRRRCFPP